MRFFELTKAARDNKKRGIKNLVVQSLKGLQEFVPIEVCSFLPYFIFFATPLELLIDFISIINTVTSVNIIKPPFHHACIPSGSRVSLYKNLFSLEYTYFDEFGLRLVLKLSKTFGVEKVLKTDYLRLETAVECTRMTTDIWKSKLRVGLLIVNL